MNDAQEVLTTELRTFEAEYKRYSDAIAHAKKYDTRAHVKNLSLQMNYTWVRIATINNLIMQLEKQAEKVGA